MKIVVFGGTGLIGTKLITQLSQLGHEAVAASPSRGVNAVTGEGVAEVLGGAGVSVDVMNAPSFEDAPVLEFFEKTSGNILAAAGKAGVKHHVALSVVGTDRMQVRGYFRAKDAQEKLIAASGIPYTILRATQFFEFLSAIADVGTQEGTVRVSPALMQPIAAEDVAAALVECVLAPPVNGVVDLAGPEPMGIDEAVRRYLTAKSDSRKIVTDRSAGYFGSMIEQDALVPLGEARLGKTRLDEWLASAR